MHDDCRFLLVRGLPEHDENGGNSTLVVDGDDRADVHVVLAKLNVMLGLSWDELTIVRLVLAGQHFDELWEPCRASRRQIRKIYFFDSGQSEKLDKLWEVETVGRVVKPVP